MARCQRNQSLLGQRCKFFSVSSWKIINYTMKKKKKRNIGSEQLSHGRGTKELRCITMLWVKKKKRGMQAQFLAVRQLYSLYQLQICPTGFCSDEALCWIRAYIPGFSGATLIWTSCKPARNSQPKSKPGASGLDLRRHNLAPIRETPVSMGITQPHSAMKSLPGSKGILMLK